MNSPNQYITDVFLNGQPVGTIEFLNQKPRVLAGSTKFRNFISNSISTGISRHRHIHQGNRSEIVEEPVTCDDLNYQLAFIEWIRRQGYTVVERRPELEAELSRLVDEVKDEKLKQKIFGELPKCSYREKTMLLRVLKGH